MNVNLFIKNLIFDWGDTIMIDDQNMTLPMYKWEKILIVPNAEIVLKELKSEYKMVVASNAGVSNAIDMKKAFERVNISKYFDLFFTSKEIGFEKPNVLFFKHIMDAIGNNPNECVMIGNSYEKDIIGAKLSGMYTVYFNSESSSNILFKNNNNNILYTNYEFADVVINNMIFLPKAINKINFEKRMS